MYLITIQLNNKSHVNIMLYIFLTIEGSLSRCFGVDSIVLITLHSKTTLKLDKSDHCRITMRIFI